MKWVSVKERLPEDATSCLAYSNCMNNEKFGVIAVVYYKDKKWKVSYHDLELKDTSHWMPLPKAPQDEK